MLKLQAIKMERKCMAPDILDIVMVATAQALLTWGIGRFIVYFVYCFFLNFLSVSDFQDICMYKCNTHSLSAVYACLFVRTCVYIYMCVVYMFP